MLFFCAYPFNRPPDSAKEAYGLSFFDDADKERMPKIYWDVDWRTAKKTIQGWVREIVGV